MAQKVKALFILNPKSGGRSRLNVAALIHSHPFPEQVEAETVYTEYAGHATSLARNAARQGYQVVAAVGGDGTVNEVARGLLGSEAALAIIPRGSGNGLARHLGVPLKVSRALEVVGQYHVSRIDSGTINGHPFFCTAGIGFDAHISAVFATSKTRGLRSYVELVLREFQGYEPSEVKVDLDGETLEQECFVVAFGNAAQYGNNAYIAPNADIRDGLLDLCLIPRLTLQAALEISVRLLTKHMASSGQAAYYTGKHIRVQAESNIMYHADGEYIGEATEFEVKVFPLSLNVLVPPLK
jgi:diacylglycerol kinase (ATP)